VVFLLFAQPAGKTSTLAAHAWRVGHFGEANAPSLTDALTSGHGTLLIAAANLVAPVRTRNIGLHCHGAGLDLSVCDGDSRWPHSNVADPKELIYGSWRRPTPSDLADETGAQMPHQPAK